MLTYLNHFELLAPKQPEINHYRACALLELRRPAEALKAIEAERGINADMSFACDLQEATAWGQMLEVEKFEEQLKQVLATKLSSVEGLTTGGISRLMTMVWNASPLDPSEPLQLEFDQRMIECAFAADGLLTRYWQDKPSTQKVELFHCFVRQPLSEAWAVSDACQANRNGRVMFGSGESLRQIRLLLKLHCDGKSDAGQSLPRSGKRLPPVSRIRTSHASSSSGGGSHVDDTIGGVELREAVYSQ